MTVFDRWWHRRVGTPRSQLVTRLGTAGLLVLWITSVLTASAGFQGRGNNVNDDKREPRKTYAIGLWGDLPYSDLQALTGVPNLIADMNRQDLEFTVHDGDFKAGNGTPASVDAHALQRRPVQTGARLFQCAEGAGDVHAGRQRLDRLRSSSERRLLVARASRLRARVVLQHALLVRQAPHPAAGADGHPLPWRRRSCCRASRTGAGASAV